MNRKFPIFAAAMLISLSGCMTNGSQLPNFVAAPCPPFPDLPLEFPQPQMTPHLQMAIDNRPKISKPAQPTPSN